MFAVAATNTAGDVIESHYFGNCWSGPLREYASPDPLITRLGPRLAVAIDEQQPQQHAWVYSVVPQGSAGKQGHLLALSVEQRGFGWSLWTNVTELSGTVFDPGTPLVSWKWSAAPLNAPPVALRKDATHLAIAMIEPLQGGWQVLLTEALPNGATIGNSIAVSETPMEMDQDGNYYEWLLVVGSDGHLYATRLEYLFPNLWNLRAWTDLGQIDQTTKIDHTTDSLAASWWSQAGVNYQTVYVRSVPAGGSAIPDGYSANVTMDPVIVDGWRRMTDNAVPGWGPGKTFLGVQTVFRFEAAANEWWHEMYGVCQDTASQLCQVRRKATHFDFTWRFPY